MYRMKRFRFNESYQSKQSHQCPMQQILPNTSAQHHSNPDPQNDCEYRFNDHMYQKGPIQPHSLSINLDRFQDFFKEAKEGNRDNKFAQLKSRYRDTMIKRAMTTYRRFPKSFAEVQQQQLQQIPVNNIFIVEKVTNCKTVDPAIQKMNESVNLDMNFTYSNKIRSNIRLLRQRTSSLTGQLSKILSSTQQPEEKTMSYRFFIDVVLNSNNLKCKEGNFPHFYNVYIQDGNNHQILKTLARRKNGWRVVQCPEVANLIWTQRYRKNLGVRPKRSGNMANHDLQKGNGKDKSQSKVENRGAMVSTSWKSKRVLVGDNNRDRRAQTKNQNRTRASQRRASNPPIEIEAKSQQDFQTLLSRITKRPTFPSKNCREFSASLNVTILNHLPGSKAICDKKNLLANFYEYFTQKGKDPFKYIPYSITISSIQDFQSNKSALQNKDISSWIVKPGQDTNRGKGISICPKWDDLQNQVKQRLCVKNSGDCVIQDRRSMLSSIVVKPISVAVQQKSQLESMAQISVANSLPSRNSSLPSIKNNKSLILQRYINPLLYNNRKFDIRMYLLVTCSNGKLKSYLYEEGYVRTCSAPFSMKNSSKYVHLTNDAIQIHAVDYGRYEEGNKLSFKQFGTWFDKNSEDVPQSIKKCEDKGPESNQQKIPYISYEETELNESETRSSKSQTRWQEIQQQISDLSRQVIKSVKNKLILPCERSITTTQTGCMHFQLYGLDYMIDNERKLWLIQVNNNPALNTDCSRLLNRIIPAMLDNMFMIAVQPYMKPHRIRDGKLENRFQVVYEE